MPGDGTVGGGDGRFPATRWSAVIAARSDDPIERRRALDLLISAYWKPVYKYIRIRWNKPSDEAQDLTQDFFTRLIEKDFIDSYDPARARLRTYLRVCVDGVVANESKAAGRLKRGGEAIHLSLDFSAAEGDSWRTAELRGSRARVRHRRDGRDELPCLRAARVPAHRSRGIAQDLRDRRRVSPRGPLSAWTRS